MRFLLFGCVLLLCVILVIVFTRYLLVGSLHIERSDPDGPYVFLELTKDITLFQKRKYIILRIDDKNYIPRK